MKGLWDLEQLLNMYYLFIPFQAVGGERGRLRAVSKVEGFAHAPHLPEFILLVSFSGTLLVVSVLGSLWLPFVAAFAVLRGLLMVPLGAMGPFWPGDGTFRAVGEVESLVHALLVPSKVSPAGKLQWHFTCGFNFRNSMIAISGCYCSPEGVKPCKYY